MSQDSIVQELLAENLELRKLLSKDLTTNIESLSSFQITEELANKLKISGVLIAEGIWNGVKYSWDELKKMYHNYRDKLSNLKIKVEHEKDKEYKEKDVGKHTNVQLNETLKAILYEGEITDPKAIKDIKEGKFRATSLKSEMRKVSLNGKEKGEDINPIDNSLTQYPACEYSKVFTIQELSENNNDIEYFGVKELEEDLYNNKEVIEEIEEENEMETENIEIKKGQVLVIPVDEELSEEFEDIEFEVMDEEEAKKKGKYYYYPRKKKYPRKIRRKKGYYYYPGEYPVPYYYWYYYPSYSKAHIEEDLDIDYEVEEELSEYKIVFNKKTKKYIVFKATGKEGFGAWKIVKQFDSKEEAKKFISGKGKTKEEDSLWEEEESKWTACIAKQRKAGKSFKEAVTTCKKELGIEKESELQLKCKVCGKEFKTQDELDKHWKEKHEKKYGTYGEYKEKEGEEKMSEELAKKGPVTCPACNKEFKTFKEFKNHWEEKHGEQYGAYKKAKKLTKKLLEDKEFRKRMKKHYLSLEELEEETSETEEKEEETKEEEKTEKEEEKTEDIKEEKKEEGKEEEKKEETKPQTPGEILETMKQKELITPEIAAELLLEAEKKED